MITGTPSGTSSGARSDALSPGRFATMAGVLGGLTALGIVSIDASLAAMPATAAALGTDSAGIKFSLSAYMVGVALGQLIQGPISDRFGRRPVLLASLVVYVLASVACANAWSLVSLCAFRFVQGFAGSGGTIISRAIVRDQFDRAQAAKLMSYVLAVMSCMPVAVPLLGGFLVSLFDWRAAFFFMAFYALVMMLLMSRTIGETIVGRNPLATRPAVLLLNYADIMRNRTFRFYLACSICGFSGLYAYLVSVPGVIIGVMGYSPVQFGYLHPISFLGQIATHMIAARLVGRYGINRLLRVGTLIAASGGLLMAALAWSGVDRVEAIIVPMFMYMSGFGLIMPMCIAAAMSPFPNSAGAASSLMGLAQSILASLVVALLGIFGDGTQLPMATAIAAAGMSATLVFFGLISRLPEPAKAMH